MSDLHDRSHDADPGAPLLPMALRPLVWPEADAFLRRLPDAGAVSSENLLHFLRGPFSRTTLSELETRYHDISKQDHVLTIVPSHPRVFTGIMTPLHNAKAAYVLGHFLSCIALAGFVGESLALFRFEIARVLCGGATLDPERQQHLWGRTFENLGQDRRIDALAALGLIDERIRRLFHDLRGVRRTYLHFTAPDSRQVQGDARKVYECAVLLTAGILGVRIESGQLALHSEVARFVRSLDGNKGSE